MARYGPIKRRKDMNAFQFSVFGFDGKVREKYVVEERSLTTKVPKVSQKHHIVIVDRSGSMYRDMQSLKDSLKKVIALHEYHDENMLLSLLSYSSMGDLTTHFVAKPISKIDPSEIDRLRATNLTCISQSLEAVRKIINKNHVTGITLHSDGFANDPSSFIEKKAIFDACEQLAKENVFVNTIAHSDYADFQLLSSVANKVSGRCVKVTGIKQLYDSVVETFAALKTGALAVSHITLDKDNYLIYLSPNEKKIIGSAVDFDLSGIDHANPGKVYGFRKIDNDSDSSNPTQQADPVVYAFARAKLAEGNINMAKYVLSSTGDVGMFGKHWRASTGPALAEFAKDLEQVAFGTTKPVGLLGKPIKIDDNLTILKVLSVIDEHKSGISLSLPNFLAKYDRRGIKRIPGERDDNGNLIEPTLDVEYVGEKDRAAIRGLDVSMTSANVSLSVTQKCRLVKKADRTPIVKVAGIAVDDLQSFRNYTIVGDGELTIDEIPVYFSEVSAFKALTQLGVLYCDSSKASKFDFNKEYKIVLKDLPVTKISVDSGKFDEILKKLFVAKIVSSFADAALKEESEKFTPEQVAELKKNYLSKNLNINFPTTTEYADLDEAIKNGKVDVRSAFKIQFGVDGILGFNSFRSANEFIERMYAPENIVTSGSTSSSGCDCTYALDKRIKWTDKKLSAKSKTTVADVFQKKVFDFILYGKSNGSEREIFNVLNEAKALSLAQIILKGISKADKDSLVKALSVAQKNLSKYVQELYMTNVFPVTFFIGTFGMAPDDWNALAMSADNLKQIWPEAKISKSEAEGVFYKTGNVVFGINAEKRYVSVNR